MLTATATDGSRPPARDLGDRPVPYNLAAEEAVLGALLIDRDAVIVIAPFLRPADFYRETHGLVYEAVLDLYRRREPADPILLAGELERRGKLELVGGYPHLFHLANSCTTAVHVEYYARRVADDAQRRRMITLGGQIAALGFAEEEELTTLTARLLALVGAVTRTSGPQAPPLAQVADAYLGDLAARMAAPPAVRGLPTGFPTLDALIGGWRPNRLAVIAAPTSGGKSALCLNFALTAAAVGAPGAIVSLEMSGEEWTERVLAHQAGVDSLLLQAATITDVEYDRLAQAGFRLFDYAPVVIHDRSVDLATLTALALRWKAELGIQWLLVDYLQIMQVETANRRRGGTRAEEVSGLAYGLRALAADADLCIWAAAQLNREASSCADPHGWLSYLRESGAIEQAANLVLFPHFPPPQTTARADLWTGRLVLAKNRQGPTGEVPALWNRPFSRMMELDSYHHED